MKRTAKPGSALQVFERLARQKRPIDEIPAPTPAPNLEEISKKERQLESDLDKSHPVWRETLGRVR